jgi:RHS repeat-associated protein
MTGKTVTLSPAGGKAVTSLTEYAYDRRGRFTGISLPDGNMLEYRRNGQGQVVALERHRIRTPWLRWLQSAEVIVTDLERDIVGLRSASYGNGVRARYQRSTQGMLARVDYRAPQRAAPAASMTLALAVLSGAGPAAAAPARGGNPGTGTDTSVLATPALPGALGHIRNPDALLDHRYLWDAEGNLLLQEARDGTSTYAYDAQNRLIVSATVLKEIKTPLAVNFSRYAYDGAGNRLLSQQDIGSQDELATATRVARYAPGSQRWLGDAAATPEYDPTGQPIAAGARDYRWDAAGQLREVRAGNAILAGYRYDHRGLRVAKETGGTLRHYLYEGRKLRAELSAGGAIIRQYVYLADQVVAVIDCDGTVPAARPRSPLAQAAADLTTVLTGWFSGKDTIAYLHTNHLGAVEAATDREGKLLWRAAYHPYGKIATIKAQPGFQLNLRLPGQYLDAETGLHYNDRRYYDPELGRYLTPDPIGLQGGVNSYAYVDGNPLKYVDPSGLILFAFDGTGNGAPGPGASVSNVWKIHQAYDEKLNGSKFYITGIGTTDVNMSYKGNMANGDGFNQRVALGFNFLNDFIDKDTGSDLVDIDVVGFSRGAAEARVWLNQLVAKMRNGRYTSSKSGKTRCLNLRFEGLFDTVSHLGYLNGDDDDHDFAIPAAVRHVAHAVALNEYRGGAMNFDVRSILGPQQPSRANRIEQAFVGAHSDIGGGYATGDLSDVALMWMLNQAWQQGIKLDEDRISKSGWETVTLPILHDSSDNARGLPGAAPHSDNRRIIYAGGTAVQIKAATLVAWHSIAETKALISYYRTGCGIAGSPAVGLVNMAKYSEWINKFGINMAFQQPPPGTHICQ